MQYYKILRDDENTNDTDLVCKSLDNYEELYSISKNDLYNGKKILNWNSDFVFEYQASKGNTFSDFVFNNLGWYIVSPKVQRIIKELNLENQVQLLPILIRDTESNETNSSYAVLNIHMFVDAFDREKSDFREKTMKGKSLLFIKKFAFLQNEVMGNDLFRVKENKFSAFASDIVRTKFVQNDVMGVDFRQVEVN